MEPRIAERKIAPAWTCPAFQYAKTTDGVNIAYWTLGRGLPLVQLTPLPSVYHLQFDWRVPEFTEMRGFEDPVRLYEVD